MKTLDPKTLQQTIQMLEFQGIAQSIAYADTLQALMDAVADSNRHPDSLPHMALAEGILDQTAKIAQAITAIPVALNFLYAERDRQAQELKESAGEVPPPRRESEEPTPDEIANVKHTTAVTSYHKGATGFLSGKIVNPRTAENVMTSNMGGGLGQAITQFVAGAVAGALGYSFPGYDPITKQGHKIGQGIRESGGR